MTKQRRVFEMFADRRAEAKTTPTTVSPMEVVLPLLLAKKRIDENKSSWDQFTGDYEKQCYDIRLKDGRELIKCWPNAGSFHAYNGECIPGDQVVKFRPNIEISEEL